MPPETVADIAIDAVLAKVAQSRRYRWVAHEVVARLAAEEIPHARTIADAEKRTKRRLHQIFGAYTGRPDYTRLLLDISTAHAQGDDALRAACRAAMAQHASTRERLAILDEFYAGIFAITGVPTTLLDIACGLNPLAAPWMGLPDDARYVACDIDSGMVAFVGGVLDVLGHAQAGDARICDVIATPPVERCDVALLLKSIPCLDQQDPAATERLLRAELMHAGHVVVSFPTQSLGGRGKGMASTYRARFGALLDILHPRPAVAGEIEFPGELVFVLEGRRG
jgi:16S rRNA (guanine(1405)-N(7))-methyltransferase